MSGSVNEASDGAETGADVSLRVEDLVKTFGDEVAVDHLSIEVERGKLKSLLGPSGCGKTTTLRCIAGLERPDSGRIYIDNELVTDPEHGVHVEPENRGLGMVFQSYAVWPHMTVEENVMYPLRIQKIGTKAERVEKVERVLDAVGLGPYADNLATNLSGGQQQRVAISRALVVEPDILLFDEPLSNLDAKLRREMRMEIKRIYQEFNTTVLYVTHSQDEAMFLSDDIAIMHDGVVVEEGPPAQLHSTPMTFFGMNFMGRCNTYEGTIEAIDGDTATVATPIGTLGTTRLVGAFDVGDQVFACFRPKFTRFVEDGEATADEVVVDGTVRMQAATRDFTEYQVDVDGRVVIIRTPEPLPYNGGDAVRFAVARDDVTIFDYADNVHLLEAEAMASAADADGGDEAVGVPDPSVADVIE